MGTCEPSKIIIVPQNQWTDFCCGAGVCSSFNQRLSNYGTDEVASSPPPQPPTQASPLLLPSHPLIIPCCISSLLSCFLSPPFFFYHLALIFFVMFSTFGVLSSLISPCAPSPPSPAPYLSTLYCFSPSSTGTSSLFFLFHRFSFFLLQGTRSSLSVLLSCACTHTRTT